MYTPHPPSAITGAMSERSELPTIANCVRRKVELVEQARVGFRILLAHDLDAAEQIRQARLLHLRFLVEQIALRDQHQFVVRADRFDRFADAGQQFHRMLQQRFAERDDAMQVARADARVGDFHRGFDHRQHHAFDAVAEQREVALLHRVQAFVRARIGEVDVTPDDVFEIPLRAAVIILAAPERVVAVEADQADG